MAYNKKGYARRAKAIQELTAQHYEPENQSRCYKAVWRKYIRDQYGLCYHSYLGYLRYKPPAENDSQLNLFS